VRTLNRSCPFPVGKDKRKSRQADPSKLDFWHRNPLCAFVLLLIGAEPRRNDWNLPADICSYGPFVHHLVAGEVKNLGRPGTSRALADLHLVRHFAAASDELALHGDCHVHCKNRRRRQHQRFRKLKVRTTHVEQQNDFWKGDENCCVPLDVRPFVRQRILSCLDLDVEPQYP